MNEQRVQAYFNLINTLLTSPDGHEPQILQQNSELLDEGFLQAATYLAQQLQQNGREKQATFLLNLVRQLSEPNLAQKKQQKYLQLIQALFQCDDEQEGLKILKDNQELIDINLLEMMQKSMADFDKKNHENNSIKIPTLSSILIRVKEQVEYDFIEEAMTTINSTVLTETLRENIYYLFSRNKKIIKFDLSKTITIFWNNVELGIEKKYQTLDKKKRLEIKQNIAFFIGYFCDLLVSYSSFSKENINTDTAIAGYKISSKIFDKSFDAVLWANTQLNLATLYQNKSILNKDYFNKALDLYNKSSEVFVKSQYPEEWASNDDRKQEIISNAISVYQNIVQACINLGQIDKAIEYVERGKARNLVDLLATRDLYPKGNIPQEVIDRLDDLRKEAIAEERRLSQQRDRRNGFGGFSMGDNRGLESVVGNDEALNRDRLNNIRQELDNLVKKDIIPVDPSFQLTQKVEPISFDKIRASLPSNKTVLIEWFIGKKTLSVFIVAARIEQPLLISYSAEEYQVLFDRFSRYLDTYQQRDRQWHNQLDNLLVELTQSLKIKAIIEQIEKLIPDCDRLILVPHRWLHLLPIHALPLADSKCLLDLFPQGVSYAPSVQLLELTQKQSKPELNNLFAVQNPTKDLKFTDVEVQAVRSQFQPNDDVLTKQQATKSALNKERLGQANAAHFSCHGYFNFENPELSALLLAGSKVEKNQEGEDKGETRFLPSRDGGSIDLEHCLTLGEIFSLDLRNCRLVTLSACETGLTDFKSLSDEYIGLPSGFLYAGSPSVVSSLWAVSDISTSFLMIKFYQNLQEIDSVAIALNQAQLWLRSVTKEELKEWKTTLDIGLQMWKIDAALINMPDGDRPYESPYYWAAFCAVGQ